MRNVNLELQVIETRYPSCFKIQFKNVSQDDDFEHTIFGCIYIGINFFHTYVMLNNSIPKLLSQSFGAAGSHNADNPIVYDYRV